MQYTTLGEFNSFISHKSDFHHFCLNDYINLPGNFTKTSKPFCDMFKFTYLYKRKLVHASKT